MTKNILACRQFDAGVESTQSQNHWKRMSYSRNLQSRISYNSSITASTQKIRSSPVRTMAHKLSGFNFLPHQVCKKDQMFVLLKIKNFQMSSGCFKQTPKQPLKLKKIPSDQQGFQKQNLTLKRQRQSWIRRKRYQENQRLDQKKREENQMKFIKKSLVLQRGIYSKILYPTRY